MSYYAARARECMLRLRSELPGLNTQSAAAIETLLEENAALIAERDALRTALRKYGRHDHFCPAHMLGVESECSCGLSALLLSAEKGNE